MNWRIEASENNSEKYYELVAVGDEELGRLQAFIADDKPWEMTLLWIVANQRSIGVGYSLFLEALKWGNAQGATDLYADVLHDEFTSQRINKFKSWKLTIIDDYTAVGNIAMLIQELSTHTDVE